MTNLNLLLVPTAARSAPFHTGSSDSLHASIRLSTPERSRCSGSGLVSGRAFAALKLERALPLFYKTLAALRLGTLHDAPDAENNLRAGVLWEEAVQRGIAMHEFRPCLVCRAKFFGQSTAARCALSTASRARVMPPNIRSPGWTTKVSFLKNFAR